ncbi:MAG: alpha/beta-type small acid-soluble spore protein [Clostridiales bacterium]
MTRKNNSVLNTFKMEIANELGLTNYDQVDKGQLSSRENGYVGGNMTKKMVAYAEQAMMNGQAGNVNSASPTVKNDYNTNY